MCMAVAAWRPEPVRLPILLRTSADTGHGGLPLSELIEQIAVVYGFIFDQLGIEFQEASTVS